MKNKDLTPDSSVFKRALKFLKLTTVLALALAAASFISGCAKRSLQQAIETAPSGAVIRLREGTWKENLVIVGKSLTIRGAGAGKTVIQSAEESKPVVWIEGDEIEVNLEGVSITKGFGFCSDPLERCPIGLVAKGSARVSLKNAEVSGNWDWGLVVEDSAQVSLQESKVSHNVNGLRVEDSAQVSLQGSTVSGNGKYGFLVGDSAQVILKSSEVSENEFYGLSVKGSAHVSLTKSQVSNNGKYGLRVEDSAQVSLQGSIVSINGEGGIFVGGSARVSLRGSTVFGNGEGGIFVGGSAQVNIKTSFIEGNGTSCGPGWLCNGITVQGKAYMELTNTTIRNNRGWGIAAYLAKCGCVYDLFEGTVLWEARGNEIYDNGKGDVCLP